MDFDTLIFALIAIVLLARLWSVFGRRNDGEPQRPNPFITPAPGLREDKNAHVPSSEAPGLQDMPPLLQSPKAAAESLAGRLEQIKTLDPAFDEKAFLQGARTAFMMIVADFAKGDLSRIERLLGPKVLPRFRQAIDARVKAGHSLENHIARVRDAETAAVRADGSNASITVRFVSEQSNVLRDGGGSVIAGTPNATEEITDLWTFTRDTKSADPNWILAETHS